MGFVSLQEDSFERIEEGFEVLRQRLPTIAKQRPDDALAFHTAFHEMERMRNELRHLLELATDPTVDFARDLAIAKKRAEQAERDAAALDARLQRAQVKATHDRERSANSLAAEQALRQQAEQRLVQVRRDYERMQHKLRQARAILA